MVNMRFYMKRGRRLPRLRNAMEIRGLFAREFLTGQEVADINAGIMGRYQAKVMVCSSVSYSVS